MSLYFLLLDQHLFHRQIYPALAAAWQQRHFAPCCSLCADLQPAAEAFAQRFNLQTGDFLLDKVRDGLAFDRVFWRTLAGEFLWLAAAEVPEIETTPESLLFLLARGALDDRLPREQRSPIEQVHFGTRDLILGGGFYRSEHAGYNDTGDVSRLAHYLASIDPNHWHPDDLAGMAGLDDPAEREDELGYVRDWFPELQALYRRALRQCRVIVCEVV